MITLKINGIEVSVKKGSTILEAAEKAGVYIPTLCHDKRIMPYGACRLCIVKSKNSRWFMPSCFTPAREGMDIETDTPEINDAIRTQLQLILINHPLECPICDKAGECTLQDLLTRYNITDIPYQLEKKEKLIDRMSPLIERDMTRCITCGRCVRICGELQGKYELDYIDRGIETIIGTDGQRTMDCDFCGLCISTCPVGALNDNLFRNTSRVWKLDKRKTVCSHCGLGCPIELNIENNTIRRVTAPVSEGGEKGILCARGQFGWVAYQNPDRLLIPRIGQKDASWAEALDYAAEKIQSIHDAHGGNAFAVVSSDALTNEEAYAYQRFYRSVLGSGNLGSVSAKGYRQIVEILTRNLGSDWKKGSFDDFNNTDALLVVGGGAVELHPVLKPLINKFLIKGDKELVVLSSWKDYCFERATLQIGVNPESREKCFCELANALSDNKTNSFSDASQFDLKTSALAKLVSLLQSDKEVTLLAAPSMFGDNEGLAQLVSALHERVQAIIPLGAQCNSYGAAFKAGFSPNLLPGGAFMPSKDGDIRTIEDIFASIERGEIKMLYIMGDDPLENYAEPERMKKILSKLDLIIFQSPYDSQTASIAHIVFPSATMPEKGGTVCSLWGMERVMNPVLRAPEGVKTDLEILQQLILAMGMKVEEFFEENLSRELADNVSQAHSDAILFDINKSLKSAVQTGKEGLDSKDFPYLMIPVPVLFGDYGISRKSPQLDELKKGGIRVIMNMEEFEESPFDINGQVRIVSPFGSATGFVAYSIKVRKGTVLVENILGNTSGLSLLRGQDRCVPVNILRS